MAEKSKKSKSQPKSKAKGKEKPSKMKTVCYSAMAVIIILILSIFADEFNKGENNSSGSLGSLEVHYIDVKQGDCILIESEGQNMLIDCGESSQSDEVTAYLQAHNISKIDYLVGTHPHSDHMGGMSAIVDNFEIS
ncbi:MAG: MBL fold metallo-hydrolase, partial [Ruminococcus sp.]